MARTYCRRMSRDSRDILDEFDEQRCAPAYPSVVARIGTVIEDRASGFCGDIVAVDAEAVAVRDRHDRVRQFRFKPGGFLIDGAAVTLVREQRAMPEPRVTNSGAVAGPPARAHVAKA